MDTCFVARAIASIAIGLASVSIHAAERRTITHDDVWLLPRVGAPAVSPDGKLAVFSVTEPAYANDRQVSDLWLVSTDGKSQPRRLTQTRASESGMAWSPDSKRLAFAAKREGDEADQIYILDIAGGGEALRATTLSTGARLPKFSPDGRMIAFTSDVPPASRSDADSKRIVAEEKARKYKMRAYDSFPIRNWDTWLPENRQPHAFVQTIGMNDARDLFAGTEMIEQPGFDGRGTQGGSELDLLWTPDGKSLIFCASRNANRGAFDYTNAELWQVPSQGGEPKRLTGGDDPKGGDAGASRSSARTVARCTRFAKCAANRCSARRTSRRSLGLHSNVTPISLCRPSEMR